MLTDATCMCQHVIENKKAVDFLNTTETLALHQINELETIKITVTCLLNVVTNVRKEFFLMHASAWFNGKSIMFCG